SLTGEWRLHKPSPAHAGNSLADSAFEAVPEPVTGPAESLVLAFDAFDRARFTAPGPSRDQIGGQRGQGRRPKVRTLLLGACLADRLSELAHCIQRTFEADALQRHLMR